MNFEINEDGDGNFIYSATQKIHTQIVNAQEKTTLDTIYRYCQENNIYPNIIDEDKLKLILQLGINEYMKRNLESEVN